MAQVRFWKEFHQLKVQVIFVQDLLLEAGRYERLIKVAVAITSSASIGAWVVWKEWAAVWATIIAGSQVLSAIHPHLPYKERIKTYSSVLRDLEKLFIEAEFKWQSIADGTMAVKQIDKERTVLQKKKDAILDKYMPNSVFPPRPIIANQAEIEATRYFSNYYPQSDEIELADTIAEQLESSSMNKGNDE